MFEIRRIGQVVEAEGRDGVGDDQVFVLRRGGQRAQRPDQRGTGERQRRCHAGESARACAVAQGGAGHGRMTVGELRSLAAIWHVQVEARPVLPPTDVGRITLVTSATKVQVENT
jgi:hypothetical protein